MLKLRRKAADNYQDVSAAYPLPVSVEPVLRGGEYYGFESLSVGTTAVALADATLDSRNKATITCEVAIVRFRLDGKNPTATVGHELFVGDILELQGRELTNFRAISRDGTTATLRCSYSA